MSRTVLRRICGQADIYFFVSERYECGFYIIMIEIYIVFTLIHSSVGFGIIWHGCRNGAFFVDLNNSESCALLAVAPSPQCRRRTALL